MTEYYKWIEKETRLVRVTGMSMQMIDIKFEVGQHPKITCEFMLKPFLERLTLEELNDLKELCGVRIKCLMK